LEVDGGGVAPTIHFVGDNINHIVRIVDGLGTFYGVSLISATTKVNSFIGLLPEWIWHLDKQM
jgi:hypothetical protein